MVAASTRSWSAPPAPRWRWRLLQSAAAAGPVRAGRVRDARLLAAGLRAAGRAAGRHRCWASAGRCAVLRANRVAFAAVLGVFLAGVFMQRAFPTERLVPVRPDGRRDRARLLAGRALHHRRQPPRALAADAVRRLPGAQPGRLPAEEPDRLERQPAVRDRRHAAAVAGGERQPGAARGWSWCRCWPSAMALQVGPWVRDAYSAWNSPAGEAVLLAAGRSSSCAATPARATGSRRSPPGATGTPTTWPGSGCRWPAAGTARTTSRRTSVLYDDESLNAAPLPGLAALAGRALRAAAGHGARLQRRRPRRKLLRSGRSGLRVVGAAPRTGRSTSCRRRRRSSRGPPTCRRELISSTPSGCWFDVDGPGQLPGARPLQPVLADDRRRRLRGPRR